MCVCVMVADRTAAINIIYCPRTASKPLKVISRLNSCACRIRPVHVQVHIIYQYRSARQTEKYLGHIEGVPETYALCTRNSITATTIFNNGCRVHSTSVSLHWYALHFEAVGTPCKQQRSLEISLRNLATQSLIWCTCKSCERDDPIEYQCS